MGITLPASGKLTKIADKDDCTVQCIHKLFSERSQRVVLEGCKSESLPVTSGVPQWSVLGPVLNLVFINDLPKSVYSSVGPIPDCTLLYQAIFNHDGTKIFQNNLNSLGECVWVWEITSQAYKQEQNHASTSNSRRTVLIYILNGIVLEQVCDTRNLSLFPD